MQRFQNPMSSEGIETEAGDDVIDHGGLLRLVTPDTQCAVANRSTTS
jgi:hypothetical protein